MAYPITDATQTQLNQLAANIATYLGQGIEQGSYEDLYQCVQDLAAAVLCIVQYNANNSSTTLAPGTQYQTAVALTNTTIATKQR